MRAATELIMYSLGLIVSLVVIALATVTMLNALGVSLLIGLIVHPIVLISGFVGYHRSFELALDLYDRRESLEFTPEIAGQSRLVLATAGKS